MDAVLFMYYRIQYIESFFKPHITILNLLTMMCSPSGITASVNGHVIDSVTDATIPEAGSISLNLSLYNADESVVIAFDNLTITEKP
jgi:hypothetical protein